MKTIKRLPWLVDVRNGVAWRTRATESEAEAIATFCAVSRDLQAAVNAGRVADGETRLSDPSGHLLVGWSMKNGRVLS